MDRACAKRRPLSSAGMISDEELKTAITKLGMSPSAIKNAAATGSGTEEWKRSRAKSLYDEGTRLAAAGDAKGAAQSFEAAYALVPHPSTAEAIATARSSASIDSSHDVPGDAPVGERWRGGGAIPAFVPGDDPNYPAWESEVTRRALIPEEDQWRAGGELPSFVASDDPRYPAWETELTKRAMPRLAGPSESEKWKQGGELPAFVPGDDPNYAAWADELTRRAVQRLGAAPKDEPVVAGEPWKPEGTVSDERLKANVRAFDAAPPKEKDDALDAMKPKSFRYKKEALDMGAPPGRINGVMAQDLQRAPLSRAVVNEGEPLTLDRDKAISLALAGVARLNERLRAKGK